MFLDPIFFFRIVACLIATTFTLGPRITDLQPILFELCAHAVEVTKDTEGPNTAKRINEARNVFGFPSCKLHSLDTIFRDFSQIILSACVLNFDDVTEAISCFPPCLRESKGVNPVRIYQRMKVQVPAVALVRNFDAVEASSPMLRELAAPQVGEPSAKLFDVTLCEVTNVFDG